MSDPHDIINRPCVCGHSVHAHDHGSGACDSCACKKHWRALPIKGLKPTAVTRTLKLTAKDVSLKRAAWSYGCATKGSEEEALLLELLLDKASDVLIERAEARAKRRCNRHKDCDEADRIVQAAEGRNASHCDGGKDCGPACPPPKTEADDRRTE